MDYYIDGYEFRFHVAPYFLRLTFEQELSEDGSESAQYDIATGVFDLKLPKKIKGELFTGLELQNALLSRKPKGHTAGKAPPLIEEIGGDGNAHLQPPADDWDENIDWSIEQHLPDPLPLLPNEQRYGFDNQYCNILTKMQANEFPVGCGQ